MIKRTSDGTKTLHVFTNRSAPNEARVRDFLPAAKPSGLWIANVPAGHLVTTVTTSPAKFGGGGRDTCPLESTSPAKFGGGGSDTCALVLLLLLLYYCYNYHYCYCYASHLYTSSYLSFPEPQVTERISLLFTYALFTCLTLWPCVSESVLVVNMQQVMCDFFIVVPTNFSSMTSL